MVGEHVNSECSSLYLAQKLLGLEGIFYTSYKQNTLVQEEWRRTSQVHKHTLHFWSMYSSARTEVIFLKEYKTTAQTAFAKRVDGQIKNK